MRKNLERDTVNKVANWLENSYGAEFKVLGKRVGLWRYPELRRQLPSYCYLHPDIDILFSPRIKAGEIRRLTGVEVKAIYIRRPQELNVRFYEGLNEAISLLRFGLDSVLFFQVFIVPLLDEKAREEIPKVFIEYPIPMREIITNLGLPLNYTPALDFSLHDKLLPDPVQVLDLKEPEKAPVDKQIILRYPGENPLLRSQIDYPKIIREFILSKFCSG